GAPAPRGGRRALDPARRLPHEAARLAQGDQGSLGMKGRLKARVRREPGAFIKAFMAAEEPIAKAATAAVSEAAAEIKAEARAQIGAAGFSRKWQNALRVDFYPKGRTS